MKKYAKITNNELFRKNKFPKHTKKCSTQQSSKMDVIILNPTIIQAPAQFLHQKKKKQK